MPASRTLFGHLLEVFATSEITKQPGWSRSRCRIFHFRTPSGREVDLVIEGPSGRIAGIEVKASSNIGGRGLQGLQALAGLAGD